MNFINRARKTLVDFVVDGLSWMLVGILVVPLLPFALITNVPYFLGLVLLLTYYRLLNLAGKKYEKEASWVEGELVRLKSNLAT